MSFYQRILGHPFVFNRIRPLFVGGIDWTCLYDELSADAHSVVVDVGCGTGIAHQYLKGFREYHGFDTDRVAIDFARRNAVGPNITYECRLLEKDDVSRIRPSKVLLSGLLHHLSDSDAVSLLRMFGEAPSVECIATADTVYVPGRHLNNVVAFMDRGRFVRNAEGFLALAREAGLEIFRHQTVRSHPISGRVLYLIMTLKPRPKIPVTMQQLSI